jgi:hypothetical protein
MSRVSSALIVCVCLGHFGCTPSSPDYQEGTGGKSSKGGATGGGGTSSTGGGTSSKGGSSGGTGGSAGSGGSQGSGGSPSTGGSGNGTGGKQGSGGTQASGGNQGGAAGRGGAAGNTSSSLGGVGGSGTTTSGSCTITPTAELSTKIKTVANVTFTTSMSNVKSGSIDFGPTDSYGMTAPIDAKATGYKTMLLGMKQKSTYHYRITISDGNTECKSGDNTVTTQSLVNGLPALTKNLKGTASQLFGGFLITGQFVQMASGASPAYILDGDGDAVWAWSFNKDVTGAVMSYDGKYMWLNNANVPSGGVSVHRVAMDGSEDKDFSTQFAGINHQLTVLPDETVAFYAYNDSKGCEDIKEFNPSTGQTKTVVNAGTAQGGASACHLNNIQYSKDDDSLVFSDLDNQVIVKVKRSDGSTTWILNGSKATLSGFTWGGSEHGIHLLALDRLLFFNNNSRVSMGGFGGGGTGSAGTADGSIAFEVKLDLTAKKASQVWTYKASPGIQNDVMGDLQRLSNGNTVIGYSTQGVLHEVSSSGTLLLEWKWPLGASFGYIQKRATLYGPPPR